MCLHIVTRLLQLLEGGMICGSGGAQTPHGVGQGCRRRVRSGWAQTSHRAGVGAKCRRGRHVHPDVRALTLPFPLSRAEVCWMEGFPFLKICNPTNYRVFIMNSWSSMRTKIFPKISSKKYTDVCTLTSSSSWIHDQAFAPKYFQRFILKNIQMYTDQLWPRISQFRRAIELI
jgi:hypothetical protein